MCKPLGPWQSPAANVKFIIMFISNTKAMFSHMPEPLTYTCNVSYAYNLEFELSKFIIYILIINKCNLFLVITGYRIIIHKVYYKNHIGFTFQHEKHPKWMIYILVKPIFKIFEYILKIFISICLQRQLAGCHLQFTSVLTLIFGTNNTPFSFLLTLKSAQKFGEFFSCTGTCIFKNYLKTQ